LRSNGGTRYNVNKSDADSDLESLNCVDVGNVVEVLETNVASIFRLEVSNASQCSGVYRFWLKKKLKEE
jgi:hypothetical protein